MVVVKVGCSGCGQPLGIALVGMSGAGSKSAKQTAEQLPVVSNDFLQSHRHPNDWSKNDIQRLSTAPRIGYDDVLDAHEFFSGLSDDWTKYLPKKTRRTTKQISV